MHTQCPKSPFRQHLHPSGGGFPPNEIPFQQGQKNFPKEEKFLISLSALPQTNLNLYLCPKKLNCSKSDETQATDSDYKQAEGMGIKSFNCLLMPLSDNLHPCKRFLQSPHNGGFHGIIRLCRGHHQRIEP